MSKDQTAEVKRVRPYPIAATLKIDGAFKKISVIMINTRGVIARTPSLMLQVGVEFDLTLELPVLRTLISTTIKVVKTYDRAAPTAGIERMAELHFTQPPPETLKQITRFMQHIGQKP